MEKLIRYLKQEMGIELAKLEIDAMKLFLELLLEWNNKFNLTSITDQSEVLIKHFFDSLTCLKLINEKENCSVIDIGTGAGFPGIPLKIMLPKITLTLVDSSHKKAEFCKTAVNKLHLKDTYVISARAEEIGQMVEHREMYDWAIARAVAELPVLVEYLLPLVKINRKVLAMKGSSAPQEISLAQRAINEMGGEFTERIYLDLPEGYGERNLIVIRKIQNTPLIYPRRSGVPSKKPVK